MKYAMTDLYNVSVINNPHEWHSVLNEMTGYDFFHSYEFHKICSDNGEGEPIIFVLNDQYGKHKACWPVLKRHIPGTDYFDFSSVYGYSGPLFSNHVDSSIAISSIHTEMQNYGAISLFSRMHPLFINQITENYRGQRLSDVVVVDVGRSNDFMSNYRGSHRREIVKAKAEGVSVLIEYGLEAMLDFCKIYHQSMLDLGATEYYYFNSTYFEHLAKSQEFKTCILFAVLNGQKIAASLFMITGNIMQYYLSGTVKEFRKLAPSKVIIARAHELAFEMGLNKIVLGGGVGSVQDALFKFKAGFSDVNMPFYVTKKILNQPVYEHLCEMKMIKSNETSFFPAYRVKHA